MGKFAQHSSRIEFDEPFGMRFAASFENGFVFLDVSYIAFFLSTFFFSFSEENDI